MSRITGGTKPSDGRTSIVRQTRAQTRAAAALEAEQANLQMSELDDTAIPFEPSFIDTSGGDLKGCAACNRPNNAELYMVECDSCKCFFHFTYAKVTTATVKEKPFVCTTCVNPLLPPTRSISSHRSSSSSVRARVARELQRLEEEKQVEDEIAREKHRLEELQRKQAFIAKKYELLSQNDEMDDRKSTHSFRSNRTVDKLDRVEDWVSAQKQTKNTGLQVDDKVTTFADPVLPKHSNPVEKQSTHFNSTPLPQGKPVTEVLGVMEEGSAEPAKDSDPTGSGLDKFILPLVDIQPIASVLDDLLPQTKDVGALPKTIRVKPPNYEQWASQSNRPAVAKLKEEHEKELERRKQRELALVQQLKDFAKQQKEQEALQCQREKQLQAELRRKEKEQQDLIEKAKQAEIERNAEIQRCREKERELAEELNAIRLEKLSVAAKVESSNHQQQNTDLWYNAELQRLKQSREENAIPMDPNQTNPGNPLPNLDISGPQISSFSNISTPKGGRSSSPTRSLISVGLPPDGIHNGGNQIITPRSMFTAEQLAARYVVNKQLPTFTGDSTEWPLFISSYKTSTGACGFTNSENMLRLQQAIKGEARETVSSLLYDPEMVPQVLYNLQLRYGKPEQIVHNLVKKVRETSAPTSLEALTSFGLMVQNLCGHLKVIGMEKHLSNPELLKQLVSKLPQHVMYNWALYQQTFPDADLAVFGDFMSRVAAATSSIWFPEEKPSKTSKGERSKPKEKAFVSVHSTVERSSDDRPEGKSKQQASKRFDNSGSCSMCKTAGHLVRDCEKFKKLSVDDRWQLVKEKKLCRRCLISHSRYTCKGEPCGMNGCQRRHHRLLHNDVAPSYKSSESTTTESTNTTTNATVTVHRQPATTTLFKILPVTLYGKNGQVNTFAFLDDGSSVTLIERKIVEELEIEGIKDTLCIHWTSGVKKSFLDTERVDLRISGTNMPRRLDVSDAYTVDDLGLPTQSMDYEALSAQYEHLRNLPIQSLRSAVPGILIGLGNKRLMNTLELREGRNTEPDAAKTRLGWAVYGNNPGVREKMWHRMLHIHDSRDDLDLHEYVRGFFAIENLGMVTSTAESPDERRANSILTETTKRTDSGRFETGLLWKYDYIELPDSRPMAEKRLHCLEKRLQRDPELHDNVCKQIADFQRKGYAHEATEAELASFDLRRTWYLPLGVVTNPKKPGKVRVIWDAAAKVDGVSLNSMLLKGPDLLTALLSVLFQFRERQIAICADIEAMFHQVLIRVADRSAQLFLWRDAPDQPIKIMVTDVAIFGATCSPTHSQFVKNLNASEFSDEFPEAAAAIQNKHYVDDYLDSVDTPEEAVRMALEVAKIHAKAGFHIRNWISNDKSVLQRIGAVNPTTVKHFAIDKDSGFERLLGIVWLPEEDVFSFSVTFRDDLQRLISGDETPTKRQLLSVVMSLYDPTGMVATFIIHGKIIIQEVWRVKVDWNEKIPPHIYIRWKSWIVVLRKLDTIKIPRCYFPQYHPDSLKSVELHVFVDASEQAYAAVAYFRIVDQAGQVRCVLVASKTKVAPLQPLSIPRLELLAAVIGVRLRSTVCKGHSLNIERVYMWSDSSNTLSWIRSTDLRRYRPYVAFRVNEIQTHSKVGEWRWVPTRFNVADEATKWGKGPSFESDSRWYQGPEFLYENETNWPQDRKELIEEAHEELRAAYVFHHFVKEPVINFDRFSKWERLLRCVAYVHRFINNCRRSRDKKLLERNGLSQEELQQAERSLWLLAQSDSYPEEVAMLNRNAKLPVEEQKSLDKSNNLRKLCPGLDEFGVLRAQNRIDAADCAGYDAKYPIILSRDHRMTHLLVDHYHRELKHKNNETVVNELRQRFDIPRLRVVVSMTAKRCMWCRVYKTEPVVPRMGLLPRARLGSFLRPFTYTGIDYFGPYLIKVGRSAVKRWVVLFTCLTTRAVHLEVAATLSTDSCKKAIRRFLDRRGHPLEIYSDRGTNFVGASRELRAEIDNMDKELASTFTDARTQWRFNPPATPHMGGSWERMVRSIKAALGVVPADRKLDDESFATLLTDAENMVNSRPLTFISLEGADQEALTPNHFLLMSSSGVIQPAKAPVDEKAALRNSWNRIQRALDGFWRRWVLEYLPTIARRTKWFKDVKPIAVGQLVVVVDEGVRNRWLRGRVIKTYPDTDGRVRQVDVQTSDGVEKRKSVARIAVLDVEDEGDAHAEQ